MNLCKLCREPIWNFICVNCLENQISVMIPRGFRNGFSDFHRGLSRYFHSRTDRFIPCLRCGVSDAPHICMPCYLNEIRSWLKDNGLLERLIRNVSFDFESLRKNLREHSALPITETENQGEKSGICDECGEYSEDLAPLNSELVCRGCRDIWEDK